MLFLNIKSGLFIIRLFFPTLPSTPTRFYKYCVDPIEFRLTQSTKQVVDRLVVGVEHVPRSWSKEVHELDIACVHRDIPKDLTLSAEERRHTLTTSGSFCHRSVEDLNPVPDTPSLDLRLIRVTQDP
jgi:hypothetical protein